MSEFSNHQPERIREFLLLYHAIATKNQAVQEVKNRHELIASATAEEIILTVDELVMQKIPMEELKPGINKFLNLVHKAISSVPPISAQPGSLIDLFLKNNSILEQKLKDLRPDIRQINREPGNTSLTKEISSKLEEILKHEKLYIIKENVLFPLLESHWTNFRCLGVMWSFHDDIRRDLRGAMEMCSLKEVPLSGFNRLMGNIYFNMLAIRFREEYILFPYALKTIPEDQLNSLLPEALALGFPYFTPEQPSNNKHAEAVKMHGGMIDLGTGTISIEQIMLIFNHLPVDITYVDESGKVRFFSDPPHRIFPRSKAIIGRDVRNCHPPESVHVVEQIVDAFRKGEKSEASFWIRIKEKMLLIRYFAVRDPQNNYKGVIEVSQEVSGIQALEGERRLLDW